MCWGINAGFIVSLCITSGGFTYELLLILLYKIIIRSYSKVSNIYKFVGLINEFDGVIGRPW